ncbi:MAG: hypothetical protein FJ303_13610 [Planctomycetes bacterium]|nr:hypothetical protein [Planctomycetota bacterium]
MPHHYTATLEVARPLPELFAYLTQTKNLKQLTPPELNLELVTAPELLTLGSRLVWKGRRWGISQEITQQVVTFEVDKLIVTKQTEGPLALWVYASQFAVSEKGTRIVEKIEYDPPGGLLGFIVTADSLRKDFDKLLAFREKKLREMFG